MTTDEAKKQLDDRVQEMMDWHFSEKTGCPFWLDWNKGIKMGSPGGSKGNRRHREI